MTTLKLVTNTKIVMFTVVVKGDSKMRYIKVFSGNNINIVQNSINTHVDETKHYIVDQSCSTSVSVSDYKSVIVYLIVVTFEK